MSEKKRKPRESLVMLATVSNYGFFKGNSKAQKVGLSSYFDS